MNSREHYHPLRPNTDGSCLYAQCWTGSKETEAMWKGFAPKEDGVMVKIDGGVLNELLNEISEIEGFAFYVGKVLYENTQELYLMKSQFDVWQNIKDGHVTESVIRLLLKKRQAFNFEDEYRLIAIREGNKRHKKNIVRFKVDSLIKKLEYVKFDPRMGEKHYRFALNALKSNFSEVNMHKSRLYSKPLKNIYFDGRIPDEINDELTW